VRYRGIAVLAALCAFLFGSAAPARAMLRTPVPPMRVMIMGDSISQGIGGDWTWRHWLWQEFVRQQVPVDFVGPRNSVATGYGTRYERTTPWDADHAALSGAGTTYFQPQVSTLVGDYRPDVLLIELGLIDLTHGDSASVVVSRLQGLIRTAWSARPQLRIVLAQITNTGAARMDLASQQVNDAMARWAVGKPQLSIAHNRTGEGRYSLTWSTALSFDDRHPNATGQTLYAHRFGQALYRLGVLPSPPDAYRVRSWAPDMVPAVAPTAGKATVSWFQATSEVAVNALEVLVDGRAVGSWIPIGKRGDTKTVEVALTPGTHRVQLVPKRGDMVGVPGDPSVVSVT
jgi:hypothetical protein